VNIRKKFRLRWVFEYHDRKPIYGVWDNASPHVSDMAWSKTKNGLKYAVIEAEALDGYAIHRIMECEADRFVTFKWIGSVSMPSNAKMVSGGSIIGLQLLTPDNAFSVFIDGKIEKKELTNHDKKFDLREFRTKVI
jgi:hypothetical protein